MQRQFTASTYIIEQEKVLLILHRKLGKWLPPGGHIDPNETPAEAACREALEETGIEIAIISQENVWIDCWNARSIERPFLCLLEDIPAYGDQPAHQHIDFIFLARPKGGSLQHNEKETESIQWFTFEEIAALQPDDKIFAETQQTIQAIAKLMNAEGGCLSE
jgi:8-oxo-dGTP pyrophosphatase MutT (NUDIX family)